MTGNFGQTTPDPEMIRRGDSGIPYIGWLLLLASVVTIVTCCAQPAKTRAAAPTPEPERLTESRLSTGFRTVPHEDPSVVLFIVRDQITGQEWLCAHALSGLGGGYQNAVTIVPIGRVE